MDFNALVSVSTYNGKYYIIMDITSAVLTIFKAKNIFLRKETVIRIKYVCISEDLK